MAQINHNVSLPNDGLGDELRTAFQNQEAMNTELYANKVSVVGGKGLSANDFTNVDKAKLDALAAGAEVNVQSDWEQADNTADDYIKNKPAELFSSVGSFHYVDLDTITTPLTVLAGVEKKITNDAASSETNVLNAPYGISSMLDTVNSQLDFSQCAIGDLVTVIPAIEITTTATNQTFQIYLKTGIGSGAPLTKQVYNGSLAVIGTIVVNATRDFTIDTLDLKDYPAEIYILSSANATVKSGELDIKVVRKDINVIGLSAGMMAETMHGAFSKTTLVDADEIAGTDSDADYSLIRVTCLNLWNYLKAKIAVVFQYKLTAGTNITIDVTDPLNPIINAAGGGGGAVDSVNGQTGVVVLDTGDIAEVTDKNYVSDSELVVLGNTSGTNTGDQDLSGKANVASPTFTGTVTTPAIIVSSETASTIASFDASKNVKSLDTATYPSLTELAYVKGLTSALQTQLDAKQPKGVRITNTTTTGTYNVDWNAADVWLLTLTGATTFVDVNLPTGTATKVIEHLITGNYAWTPPVAYWVELPSSQAYDGTKLNHIVVTCINGTPGSELVYYSNETTT